MNCFSILGIFVVVLFAYCTPTQGQTFAVAEATLWDRQRFITDPPSRRSTKLIRVCNDSYKIWETITYIVPEENKYFPETYERVTFEMRAIYTMIDTVFVVRTHENLYCQIKLLSRPNALQLFNLTARPKLYEYKYSFGVSAIYKCNVGRILTDVGPISISGFFSNVENSELRYIIHSGEATANELIPHLLWTANNFNYRVYDNKSIVFTIPILFGRIYDYYLVKFSDPLELTYWKTHYGKFLSNAIHEASGMILDHFQRVYDRNA